jgi:hypothetical protein
VWGGSAPSGVHYGYATFHEAAPICLMRLWFEPQMRRQGGLSAIWPTWRERYGDFEVSSPSPGMQAFLVKHD